MVLHQGNVLVRGCMIDDRGAMPPQDLIETAAILDATDLWPEVQLWKCLSKLPINLKERCLRNFVTDDLARTKTRNLSAEFRANRTRSAGDHHHLIPKCF